MMRTPRSSMPPSLLVAAGHCSLLVKTASRCRPYRGVPLGQLGLLCLTPRSFGAARCHGMGCPLPIVLLAVNLHLARRISRRMAVRVKPVLTIRVASGRRLPHTNAALLAYGLPLSRPWGPSHACSRYLAACKRVALSLCIASPAVLASLQRAASSRS